MKRFFRPLLIVVCFTVFAFMAAFSANAGNVSLKERFSPSRVMETLARLNPLRVVPNEAAGKAARRMPDALSKSQVRKEPRLLFAQAAAPFVVNITSDAADVTNTDNACDTDATTIGSQCSLRAAIQQSNTTPDANTINFNIPGGGVQIISPTSALPVIGNQVTINGYTQPGATTNTNTSGALNTTLAVVLDGTNAGAGVSGLTINGASNCAIRGLNIRNFRSNGLVITNTATANTIAGCFIGTNNSGTVAAPNIGSGVQMSTVIGNTIGGLTAADRNLISGNGGTGIIDVGDGTPTAIGNTIQGNIIGLNAATTAKIANNIGIQINSRDSTIVGSPATGGILTGAANIISGNTDEGVSILNFIAGNDNISVRGNRIGTNSSSAAGLGNGADGVFIGGVGSQVLSNTIIGNGGNGVHLFNATSVVIQRNNLGFASNGNAGSGVFLSNGAINNIIGGAVGDSFATAEANGNLIAGNLTGVSVDSGGNDATGNSIRGNTIEQNTALGINLNGNGASGDGVTPNDLDDPDTGDNTLQNFPVITSVSGNVITGTLNSTPNTTFVLDFYDNNVPSAAVAEGSFGLGSTTVPTNAAGDANFSFTATGVATIIGFTTATATDPAGNTSEFSSGVRATPSLSITDVTAPEGDSGTAIATFTVVLSAASAQTITVDFATANNTAIAPGDYAAQTGTLTFTPGQSAKTITVLVQGDTLDEANETYFVNLTNATNATIADAQGVGTITDNDATPTLRINDVTVTEGNTGTTTATFTVTLSALSGRNVTVNYATANGTATQPADYASTASVLSLPAGQPSGTVTIIVNGDTVFEPNETFFVNLTTPSNATIADNQGIGTILNDDASLVVTTTNDTINAGDGLTSLREAITFANANAGVDTITFNIPGAGVQTIAPSSPLPTLTEAVTIDGYSQPGSSVNTNATGALNSVLTIEIRGPAANGAGLRVNATNSLIRGLVINRFSNSSGITLIGNSNRVEGCFIGTDANGLAGFVGGGVNISNGDGVAVNGGANSVIGGVAAAARNLISANKSRGISISGPTGTAGNTEVQGNLIGTDKSGNQALGNGARGVEISGFTTNTIGGGAANLGNVISGNGAGIFLFSGTNSVQGNIIGLSADGTNDIGNGATGVYVQSGAGNVIGGNTATVGSAPGNIISGNDSVGIDARLAVRIQGNMIGLNAAGTAKTPNDGGGIALLGNGSQIGGVFSDVDRLKTRNIISGNGSHGIIASNGGDHIIQGNYIGSGSDFNIDMGNNGHGVFLNSVNNNTIGRLDGATGDDGYNVISFNALNGVRVTEFGGNGVGNRISINVMFSNGGLGINLVGGTGETAAGVTPNDDDDPDTGANNLQNFPVITSVVNSVSDTKISGTLNSRPNTTYRIEFFTADTNGEGRGYIGGFESPETTTDANGDSPVFDTTVPRIGAGTLITAIAIAPNGDTSEFSPGVSFQPSLSINDVTLTEGDAGTANALFTVSLSEASAQQIKVNFATANGTATAPADYTAQNGTLTFAPSVTTQTISVPVVGDTIDEADETFFVNLSAPVNATIRDAQGRGTITDDDTTPTLNFVVDTISDANLTACTAAPNDCSLRGAINNANLRAGADTITFNIPGAGLKTIAPATALPQISGLGTVIDGYSQPGSKANSLAVGNNAVLLIELNGAAINASGLNVTASNAVVKGLIINRFGAGIGGDGIVLSGNNSQVAGCFIGTNATGAGALPNVGSGISIFGDNNRIGGLTAAERNVISGNKFNGVHARVSATGTLIRGNYLGTNAAGATALGNASVGILIESNTNTVGGDTAAARNVVSGNGIHGIAISGGSGNLVRGNYVGTSANGNADLGNTRSGVRLEANATNNTVGGTIAGSGNVLSGNDGAGIVLTSAGTTSNSVQGNFIGTGASGLTSVPNTTGVLISVGAQTNTLGGTLAGTRNIISGNTLSGIEINAANNNRIEGNTIGLNANGAALSNGEFGDGIQINAGAKGNIVGGTVAGARNIISGNNGTGVSIDASSTNQVRGNYIGTNSAGNAAIKGGRGVRLTNGATGNIIGGTTAAFRNVISGCEFGVAMGDATTTGNAVLGNYLGTNAAGSAALSNRFGVGISGASRNTIGGTQSGARNLISGNVDANVYIADEAAGNSVLGNFIGTTLNGAASMGAFSTTAGVWIDNGANGNIVGGNTPAARNIVSGNAGNGILITGRSFGVGTLARANRVTGNYIGVNAAGNAKVPNNGDGVALTNGALNNVIGAAGGGRNLVSGNARYGISMEGAGTDSNIVQNNWVGLNTAGTGVLGNVAQGIVMHDGAQRNRIGGDAAGTGNVVAGNTHNGIGIGGVSGPTSGQNTAFNIVQGNFVGTDPTGKLAGFGNTLPGIAIAQGAHDNLIGGTTAGARNVISGNKSDGIFLGFPDARANRIQGNYVGVNAEGSSALPNTGNGIAIADNAHNNIIGGAGGRNIISGNTGAGIFVSGAATANVVQSNYIGTNVTGSAALGNGREGINITDASGNLIGGGAAAARNIISGNNFAGVALLGNARNNNLQGNYIGLNAAGTAAIANVREGLFVNASNNTIGGITTVPGTGAGNVVAGNRLDGIHLGALGGVSARSNRVLGNIIGLNAAGNAALPNAHGVLIDLGAQNNSIGGAATGARNVISGNTQRGIYITGAGTTGNRVEGNYIGTTLSGLGALANQFDGVTITFAASNNIIGGLTNTPGTGAGNVVSGNLISGVSLEDGATDNFVYGNAIGVGSDGRTVLPNRPGTQVGWGVLVESASRNTIGTTSTGANLIANNSGPGFQVLTSRGPASGNRFRGNRVFNNGGLGIDLGANGVTANDTGDGDGGANNLQNHPVLTSATQNGAAQPLIVKGSLDSTVGRTFTIDAFSNDAVDPSGFGEGQTYLGSFVVGNGAFTKSLTVTGNLADKVISLTATDNTSGDTSEFSRALLVALPVAITVTVRPNPVTINAGATQQFTATLGGTTNQNVTWSVDGGAANGTITGTGLYTAPAVPGTYTVRARSVADNTVSGTATVNVVRPPAGQPLLGWGYNQFGSVGDGSNTNRLAPVTVDIIQDARLIAAGGSHNLAVAGNVLYAWGDNEDAQLGDGSQISRNRPVIITLPGGIRADTLKAIACGWYHSMALTNDGRVLAWGYNKDGQCGVQADAPRFITAPRVVAGLSNITAIAGGTLHSLALDSNGKVWAWGNNFYGQLGNGSIENVNATPTIVPNLPAAKAIGAGGGHSVALLTNGTAQAWGWNFYGQLGDGLSGYQSNGEERRSARPVLVKNIASGAQISAGYAHNLLLKTDGTLQSWGNNFYGQLGRTTPNANDGLASSVTDNSGAVFGNVRIIAAGSGHNLVLRLDNTIWSWGYNEFGNLGLGTITNQTAPQQVPNLVSGQAIAAGYAHSIAIAKRGTTGASEARKPTIYLSGSAYASNNSVTLTFSASLKSIATGNLRVLVNNREVEVQSSNIGGATLTILLPQGALNAGDEVIVAWSQLQTQAGESLTGNSPILTVE